MFRKLLFKHLSRQKVSYERITSTELKFKKASDLFRIKFLFYVVIVIMFEKLNIHLKF